MHYIHSHHSSHALSVLMTISVYQWHYRISSIFEIPILRGCFIQWFFFFDSALYVTYMLKWSWHYRISCIFENVYKRRIFFHWFFMDAKHSYMCYSNSATLSNLVYFLYYCTRACSYIFHSKDSDLN